MNVHVRADDERRIEVLAQDLLCSGGARLAIDVTLRSALRSSGEPQFHATDVNGAIFFEARGDKEATNSELASSTHCSLFVVAVETGGWWSEDAAHLVWQLAPAKAREIPHFLTQQAALAWERRWTRLPSTMCAISFATSLVDPESQESMCATAGQPIGQVGLIACRRSTNDPGSPPCWWNIWKPRHHACKQLPQLQGTSPEWVGSSPGRVHDPPRRGSFEREGGASRLKGGGGGFKVEGGKVGFGRDVLSEAPPSTLQPFAPPLPRPTRSWPTLASPFGDRLWAKPTLGQADFGPSRLWAKPTLGQADFGPSRLWAKPTLGQTDFGPNRLWAKPTLGQTDFGPNRLWAKPTLGQTDFGPNRLWAKPTLGQTDFGQTDFGPNRLWAKPTLGQTDFGPNRLWAKPTLAKPTLAKPTLAKPTSAKPTLAKPTLAKPTLAKPTLAKPTLAKPTLTCGVVCWVWCVVCLYVYVWRGCWFHGFMVWGFTCGCWFGRVRDRPSEDRPSRGPPFPGAALPGSRPKFRSFFPSPAAKCVLFFPLWGSSRGILVFLKRRELKCARLGSRVVV